MTRLIPALILATFKLTGVTASTDSKGSENL